MKLTTILLFLSATLANAATYLYPVQTPTNSLTPSTVLVIDANGKAVAGQKYTNANTASTIVARDGSGNFSAGTITATLTGNASSATVTEAQTNGTYFNITANGTNTFTRIGIGTNAPQSSLANVGSALGGTQTATNSLVWETKDNNYAAIISSYASSGLTYGLRLHTYGATSTDYPLVVSSGSGSGTIHSALTAQGHLGLGTITPASLLTMKDTANGAPYVRILNGAGTTLGWFGTASGLHSGVHTNYMAVRAETGLVLSGTGNNYDMVMTNSKIGIIALSPQYTLDVNGTGRFIGTNTLWFGGTSGAADGNVGLYNISSGRLVHTGTLENVGNMNVGFYGAGSVANFHVKGAGSTAPIAILGSTGNSPTNDFFQIHLNGTNKFSVDKNFTLNQAGTITTAGTTGAQTINNPLGSVNFAAAATTLVVTSSAVGTAADTLVFVQVNGTDATFTSARVTVGTGQFTITANAAATAETAVSFQILKIK